MCYTGVVVAGLGMANATVICWDILEVAVVCSTTPAMLNPKHKQRKDFES